MPSRVDAVKLATNNKQTAAVDHLRRRPLVAATVASILVAAAAIPLRTAIGAQPVGATNEDPALDYSVPPGDLSKALNTFADVSGLHLVYSSSLTTGLKSTGVTGRHTVRQALAKLLEGTGLTYRFTDRQSVSIERAPGANGAHVLGPLQVEGAGGGNGAGVAGVNGSNDPTATEGTHSYTTSAVTTGAKMARDPKEIQQSISVLTQQQIQDQNITDTYGALNQLTGITLIRQGGYEQIFTRGFAISGFSVDGGSTTSFSFMGNEQLPDLSIYDHVELLRGSDGNFTGVGDPSGVVNLVRKKPLDHDQVLFDGLAGEWNNYRSSVDVTGPLNEAGSLRGRVVATTQDRDEFYKPGYEKHNVLYGILEYDLTSSTLLTAGFDNQKDDSLPLGDGLPKYDTGEPVALPRSENLVTDWTRLEANTTELFAKIEQKIGSDWKFTLNASDRQQNSSYLFGYSQGGPPYSYYYASYSNVKPRHALADATLSGSFDLFGRKQELTIGASYEHDLGSGVDNSLLVSYVSTDIFHWNPNGYPQPQIPNYPVGGTPTWLLLERAAYAAWRSELLESWHLNAGVRHTEYSQTIVGTTTDSTTGVVTPTLNGFHESHATPFVGTTYDVNKNYALYTSWASIFSPRNDVAVAGGPLLPPTTGDTWETGAKASWWGGKLTGYLAWYDINQKDVPYPVNSCPVCWIDLSGESSHGVDSEVKGELLPGWQISAGYTYDINTLGSASGKTAGQVAVSKQPHHLLKLWSMYQLPGAWSKLRFGGGMNGQSSSYREFIALGHPYQFVQPTYEVFSLRADYQLTDRWQIGFNLNNLFNRVYFETLGATAGTYYGEPFNWVLSVHAKY